MQYLTIIHSIDKSLAGPGRKQANVSVRIAWFSFGALPCRKKKNLMTARVSMLLKSRASVTCFWACFFPGRAKDLPEPRCSTKTLRILLAKVHGKIFRFRQSWPGYVPKHGFQFVARLFYTAYKFSYINTLRNIYVLFIDSGKRRYCTRYTNVPLFFEFTDKTFVMKCPGAWCDQAATIMDTINETLGISQNRMWKRFQAIFNSGTQNTTQKQ